MRTSAAITLLTDYGTADTYVGQVKGVLIGRAPGVQLIDLTHAVPPQDIRSGAFHLWAACLAFPAGTVHVAVVDPGVGSSRRAVALETARGDLLVGPDNGLLMPAALRLGGIIQGVSLAERAAYAGRIATTFDGRDLFAPAAAALVRGAALRSLGSTLGVDTLTPLVLFPPHEREGNAVIGRVVEIDRFGNAITSLEASVLPPRFEVHAGAFAALAAPVESFAQVDPGAPLALIGSQGLLELCIREGDAAARCQLARGARVRVNAAP